MIRYGQRKTHTLVKGHQNCSVCHPEVGSVKNLKARARRAARKEIKEATKPASELKSTK